VQISEYNGFRGYFTIHNVPFKPRTDHPDCVANQDRVPSDIDVIGYHPRKRGCDRVAVVTLDELSASAMAAQGSAQQRVASVSAQLERRRRLEAQIEDDRARAEVLNVLARELRADRFMEFIIQETLDLLATRASNELRRISDGRYSLTSADGQFSVIDHLNADEQRSVKTLSGGKTFLASLALALASPSMSPISPARASVPAWKPFSSTKASVPWIPKRSRKSSMPSSDYATLS
jgi:hypothetical protein